MNILGRSICFRNRQEMAHDYQIFRRLLSFRRFLYSKSDGFQKMYKIEFRASEIFWVSEFRCGRTSASDKPHSGLPKSATNNEMVDKIPWCPVSRSSIEDERDSRDHRYLRGTRWPYPIRNFQHEKAFHAVDVAFLPPEQKRNQMIVSEECLARIQRNSRDFFHAFRNRGWN